MAPTVENRARSVGSAAKGAARILGTDQPWTRCGSSGLAGPPPIPAIVWSWLGEMLAMAGE